MNINQFGQMIKAKYPQYAKYSDDEIGMRVLAKYPQYQSQVSFGTPNQASSTQPGPGVLKTIGNVLTSSEQAFGHDIAGAASNVLPASWTGKSTLDAANQQMSDSNIKLAQIASQGRQKALAEGHDTTHYDTILRNLGVQLGHGGNMTSMTDLYPSINKSSLQVLGDAGGVLADILSAGSYGSAAKGTEAGKLLTKGGGLIERGAAKIGLPTTERIIEEANTARKPLGAALKTIGKEAVTHSATGGVTGYGYDVVNNAQHGKTGADLFKPGVGTATGAVIPLGIGIAKFGLTTGRAITSDVGSRLVNSLVKPKQADFAYGKNPGRTVAELGITGKNINDFEKNVSQAKSEIGDAIGNIYRSPENASIKIDASDEIKKIDNAIQSAAKGGKNNQYIVNQLQNIKDSLLYEHGIDENGVIQRISTVPRDLSSLSPEEAFNLKKTIAEATQFTGRPSDDKAVNSTLKDMYSGLKQKLNTAIGENNPEIMKLNQQYADLTSADIAVRNRAQIISRSNLVSFPVKVGGAVGVGASILSGGVGLPAILMGVGAGALDKALSSTAVKTHVAKWLSKESPNIIENVLQKNPDIAPIMRRAFPLMASKLGKSKVSPSSSK